MAGSDAGSWIILVWFGVGLAGVLAEGWMDELFNEYIR